MTGMRARKRGLAMEPRPRELSTALALLALALLLPHITSASSDYNRWYDLTKISPGSRQLAAVASFGDSVYVYGGLDSLDVGNQLNGIYSLDMQLGKWTYEVSSGGPNDKVGLSMVAFEDSLYVFGKNNSNGRAEVNRFRSADMLDRPLDWSIPFQHFECKVVSR
eukprot:766645-Hanusia_phi.AAC.8